ncbi:MAG TPA: hypothetical protein VKV37_12825 [Ktedonobacteraceae bacterium]|jgi:hypothetical protein|nr:hypothetical protein [Ktedonobacteraceae bacterium]
MSPFEQYLNDHNIEPLRLSIEAGVRYLTVYNATKGKPVSEEHARKIRIALYRLTGEVYTGPLPTLGQAVDQIPTLPIRKLPRFS